MITFIAFCFTFSQDVYKIKQKQINKVYQATIHSFDCVTRSHLI